MYLYFLHCFSFTPWLSHICFWSNTQEREMHIKYPSTVFCWYNKKNSLMLHCWHNCQFYLPQISAFWVSELTLHTPIHSRWRGLAETSGEVVAHDNQDHGPVHRHSPSGKSGVRTTPCAAGSLKWNHYAFHKGKTTRIRRGLVVVCTSAGLMERLLPHG